MVRAAVLACFLALALGAAPPAPKTLIYRGELPAADASVRAFLLTLRPNGIASFAQEYAGKGEIVDNGKWNRTRSGEIRIRFVPREGQTKRAPSISWQERDAKLIPAKWDRAVWGETGPPQLTPVQP